MTQMGFPFSFAGTILPVVVLVVVIAVIVALVRRRRGGEEEPGIGTLRRLYYYGLSFVALMVAASGIVLLVDYVADRLYPSEIVRQGETQAALAVALTVVATPIWFLHWRMAQKSVREFPAESRVLSRRIYLYSVLGVSAVLTASGLTWLLAWLLGAGSFNGLQIAFPVIWGGIWGLHWWVRDVDAVPKAVGDSVHRLYLYGTSVFSLSMLAVGVGVVLALLLGAAYHTLFGTELLPAAGTSLWRDNTRIALAIALVGGGFWWWHWHRVAPGDIGSALRSAYLYLFAILSGAATVVVCFSVLLYTVLQWLMGSPEVPGAAVHFQVLPGLISALAVGTGLWGYHWALVQDESRNAARRLPATRRVYRYLVTALGLGTLAVGLVIGVAVVLGLLVPASGQPLLASQWWRNPLTLAITLLVVGIPLWSFYWFGAQKDAKTAPREEGAALSRRVFLYLVFGIAVLLSLGNLIALLFIFLRALLDGQISTQVVHESKWAIGMLLMAGAISGYYWLVLREDHRAIAP